MIYISKCNKKRESSLFVESHGVWCEKEKGGESILILTPLTVSPAVLTIVRGVENKHLLTTDRHSGGADCVQKDSFS
jgi:hypothetical protein